MPPRPQPPHGDRARYHRGCRCLKCTAANKRYCKEYRLIRHTTGPCQVDAATARREAARLAETWSHGQIAAAAGCDAGQVARLLRGQYRGLAPRTERGLLNAHRILADQPGRAVVEATGTIRRGRALIAYGYSCNDLAAELQARPRQVRKWLHQRRVQVCTAQAVGDVYRKLSCTPGPHAQEAERAAERGWAPPICWEDDTIDDPDAFAEWTGNCGTDRGWHVHRAQRIPTCPPCQAAHQAWLTDHSYLAGSELPLALANARAQALGRSAAVAENARELLAQDLSWDAICQRLGASRNYIAAALRRHELAV